MFIRGTWTPEQDEIAGEWVEVAIAENNVIEGPILVGDGTTGSNPTAPTVSDDVKNGNFTEELNGTRNPLTQNVPIKILETIKNGKIDDFLQRDTPITSITVSALPSGTTFRQGDVINLLHPITGETENITLAANTNNPTDPTRYEGGNTTLFIESFIPSVNYENGSYLIKDNEASPVRGNVEIYKVNNYTGAFIDVPFDIPVDGSEIDKRLTLIRSFATGIFGITFQVGNDANGDRRRITPNIAFSDEAILIKLQNT